MRKFLKFDYLYAWPGFFLTLLVLGIISFNIPPSKPGFDLSIVLTISTFLFGMFAAFVTSERYTRFEKMRDFLSIEVSEIPGLYEYAKSINEKEAEQLKKLLDEYLIASFDYELDEYQIKIEGYFDAIESFINNNFNILNKKSTIMYTALLRCKERLSSARKEISLIGRDRLEITQWVALTSLGLITITTTLLYLNTSLFAKSLAVLFSSIIILLMLTIRDLDNLRWRKDSISIEPFEEAFEDLGLLRYYDKNTLLKGRSKPPKGVSYRVGLHNPGEEPNVKLVKDIENP